MRMFLKSWETCRVLAHGARTCICHTYGHSTLGDRGRLAPVRFWPLSACWLLCWSVAGGAGPEALERRNTGCILAPVRLAPVPFLPLSTCWLLCWLVAGVADGLEDAVACCNPSTLWLTAVARPTLGAGDTNPRPPPAAPSPSGTTWGVCWTMSASGLPLGTCPLCRIHPKFVRADNAIRTLIKRSKYTKTSCSLQKFLKSLQE